jgi:hypothetical protein
METEQSSQFKEFEIQPFFRRNLMPVWFKVFCWIFMIFGAMGILNLMAGLLNYSFSISLYGLESDNVCSIMGILATAVFLFKGLTAYSLWYEKSNAITLGKIDAAAGIVICIVMMVVSPILEKGAFSFRFEIIFLIAYYRKLSDIEYAWHNLHH